MYTVKRRYVFILLPVILLLLGGGVALYFINRQKIEAEDEIRGVVLKNASAIPVDAIALYSFRDISFAEKGFMDSTTFFSSFIRKENGLFRLIRSIDKVVSSDSQSVNEVAKSEALFSVHYSARNELSLLFCLDLSNKLIDKEQFRKSLEELYPGGTSHLFNGVKITSLIGVQFSIYNDIFIASTSSLVLESSIRHLLSKTSIMDNPEFSKLLTNSVNADNILFVNHQNIGKVFSGITDGKFWGYADFFSKFSSWTTLNGEFDKNFVSYKGEFTNLKSVGNYSYCYKNLKGEEPEVMNVLPYNTFGVMTLPLGDFKRFLNLYRKYQELYKRLNAEGLEEHEDWFLSLNPQELSLALIPYGSTLKWVTLVRSKHGNRSKPKVERFTHRGAISDLFGEIFSNTSEYAYCNKGEWTIIGSQEIIGEFVKGSFTKFTMDDYFCQCEAYGKLVKDHTLFSLVVNVSSQSDTLASLFKPAIKGMISGKLKEKNFEFISYQLSSVDKEVEMSLLLYARQLERLPVPKSISEGKPAGWEMDTIIQIPAGPFELKNFNNGDTEYLEQLPNYKLRMLDKDKKGVWAVPFSTPLRGYVAKVDYFRNHKQQMLFASGNQLYLLDRTGRFVGQFPKRVDSLIMLGPKTYNLKGDGDYAIMLLHTDNCLRLYDRECKPYPAWNDIKTPETIKEFPDLIKVGQNRYWVLRTQIQTIIYTINGNPVTKFTNKNILSPATGLKVVSNSEVIVTTNGGKDIILNLESGKIKRYRK